MNCPACGHDVCTCEEEYKQIEKLINKKLEIGLSEEEEEELDLLSRLMNQP